MARRHLRHAREWRGELSSGKIQNTVEPWADKNGYLFYEGLNAFTHHLQVDIYHPTSLCYELATHCDSVRVTKMNKVYGSALCPLTDTRYERLVCLGNFRPCRCALLMSTGRVVVYELQSNTMNNPTTLADLLEQVIRCVFSCGFMHSPAVAR